MTSCREGGIGLDISTALLQESRRDDIRRAVTRFAMMRNLS